MSFKIEKTGNLEYKKYGGMVSSVGNDDKILLGETGYSFLSGVVVDYFSKPEGIFSNRFDEEEPESSTAKSGLRSIIANKEKIELIPKNSIIAYILDGIESKSTGEPFLCYPFFPSNIAFPIKPGEHVWLFGEKNRGKSIYYWVCRKTAPFQIEDINHTILDRYIKNKDAYHTTRRVEQTKAVDTFYNFHENVENIIYPDEINLVDIIDDANATIKETISEPVPFIDKKAGDILFQGSNNAYIHLTTEKFTTKESCNELYPEDYFVSAENKMTEANRTPFSPAIDISVASFKNDLIDIGDRIKNETQTGSGTLIYETENLTVANNTKGYHEINKANDKIKEANQYTIAYNNMIDPLNCGGRIYMSNNCKIDDIFLIKFGDLSSNHGSSLMMYSDYNRILSNKNFKIVVGNVIDATTKQVDSDTTQQAIASDTISYIEIKGDDEDDTLNGNIIIKPHHEKHIYLGGHDATEQGVLGNKLVEKLTTAITEIRLALDGILAATPATPAGPAGTISATSPNAPDIAIKLSNIDAVKEELQEILSEFVLIKGKKQEE